MSEKGEDESNDKFIYVQHYKLPLFFIFLYVRACFDIEQDKYLHATVIFQKARSAPVSLRAEMRVSYVINNICAVQVMLNLT